MVFSAGNIMVSCPFRKPAAPKVSTGRDPCTAADSPRPPRVAGVPRLETSRR